MRVPSRVDAYRMIGSAIVRIIGSWRHRSARTSLVAALANRGPRDIWLACPRALHRWKPSRVRVGAVTWRDQVGTDNEREGMASRRKTLSEERRIRRSEK